MNEREAFASDYDVSRETMDSFDWYAAMLTEATQRFNLVAPSTIANLWQRHFADSAQLLAHISAGVRWLDLGSGAGLPGLVLALLGAKVELVEATGKKASFLRTVVDRLGLQHRVQVAHCRIEDLIAHPAPVITARALAPLPRLFDLGLRFATNGTRWILPKGAGVRAEIEAARRLFDFNLELRPSRTSTDGQILLAQAVERKVPGAAVHR